MTEAPPPCEACGQDSDFQRRQAIKICDVESENRQLKFDLESAQSINEQKDAENESAQAAWETRYSILVAALVSIAGSDTIGVHSEYIRMKAEARRALEGT